VLFSSGDWGVGGGDCQTNDGTNATRFQPMFPATCKSSPISMQFVFGWRLTRFSGPFVTTVGGTTGIKPETAIFLTGGGFSNYFSRPSYQDKDVTAYIKNLNGTYDGLYKCDLCLLAFCEPPLKSLFVYHVTVLKAVEFRMLRLIVTGSE
jgi:tripeptidyl-peptidase-1